MRSVVFASRNLKELVRDPLMSVFCIGFPVVLLLLMSAIQAHAPVRVFPIEQLSPGIAVFAQSFISLFAGFLLAKDRTSSFLMRLYASPLTASDFLIGYILPLLPLAILQSVICFLLAFALGLPAAGGVLLALAVLLPSALLFIGIGLLIGTLVNDKAVGGIASILINAAGWLSGTWFDLNMVGGGFRAVGYALPFAHAVDAARAALTGDYGAIVPHLAWVCGYAAVFLAAAILLFQRKMRSDKA